ncbi:MAG TPA: MarC family protein [Elusimicrobiota bacterium]|nr:MarC family protein [Elusimicrobiota bacterium]
METFIRVFVPLFVAIDVFGVLPLYIGLVQNETLSSRQRIVWQSSVTALAISLVFLFMGKWLFAVLGISEDDFRIGGGIVLLVLAIKDMLFAQKTQPSRDSTVGVVPIGIPLIIGPAALTTILLLVDTYGYHWTFFSLLLNLLIAWLVFHFATPVSVWIGRAGLRALSKVAALFLSAIAVMMIRRGIMGFWHG